ncbi:hypothetical protein QY97_01268 [Bacillus thermotolerans]|nr:hypothetical protein QY97_01268 [Bacillus thermotolerans]
MGFGPLLGARQGPFVEKGWANGGQWGFLGANRDKRKGRGNDQHVESEDTFIAACISCLAAGY